MTTTYHSSTTADSRAVEEAVRVIMAEAYARTQGGTRDLGPIPPAATPAPGDQTRFLGSLIGTLASAVTQAVPAIVQGFVQNNRDLFGEDTRDAATQERFFGSIVSALMPVVTQAAPVLAQLLGGNRGVPQNDDEIRTKWLGPLLGTVLPGLVQAVPSIVQSLTGGSRSVSVTDPGEATRFLGPLLAFAVPALVEAVPAVIDLFNE